MVCVVNGYNEDSCCIVVCDFWGLLMGCLSS